MIQILSKIHLLVPCLFPCLYAIALSLALGCSASHHATRAANLGEPSSTARLEASLARPGIVGFERVVAADWKIARSGLINLDHNAARAAGLEDGPEEISVFFYVLEHPRFGTFLVDSGAESGFLDLGGNPRVSAIVEAAMGTESLQIRATTSDWLETRTAPVAGVFLTHIHLDHIMGLPDLPKSTRIFVGPGEAQHSAFLNMFTRGTIDRMLEGFGELEEWGFAPDSSERFVGVVDVFSDGSVWAIHVPGHTPGSTAFVVNSTTGPKLLVGDASHTRWGWENGVEPGTFTFDHEANRDALARLRRLAEENPAIEVFLGHQP